MRQQVRVITERRIRKYIEYLILQEKSEATVQKYRHDLLSTQSFFCEGALTKAGLIEWKKHLMDEYAPASVNTKIAAMNGFLLYMGWSDLILKPIKIQKQFFSDVAKELTREEYRRLIQAAEREGDTRISLVIQTICSTGIRVSELRYITAEAVNAGRAEIRNKGKHRTVFLPNGLRRLLREYLRKQKKTTGSVFVTRNGKPLNRTNIWRDMKALCTLAHVDPGKVFPHNLRHLFARIYYSTEKDLSRLADILGHSNVNTTKIYTMESGIVHATQIEKLGLIITS